MLTSGNAVYSPVASSSDCLFQVSGTPLTDLPAKSIYLDRVTSRGLKRPAPSTSGSAADEKRLKTSASASASYNSILFQRSHFYHSQPSAGEYTNAGMSRTHVLNRLARVAPHEGAQVRHLLKYIWPRLFGLSSPLDGGSSRAWHDREHEIQALGPCKTPKPLKGDLERLAGQMIHSHRQTDFATLLNRHVRSRMKDRVLSQSEKSELLVSCL